jgi:hypothetical protein
LNLLNLLISVEFYSTDTVLLTERAESLLVKFESYLNHQETSAGYKNTLKIINNVKNILNLVSVTPPAEKAKVLIGLIKTLKACIKIKYC